MPCSEVTIVTTPLNTNRTIKTMMLTLHRNLLWYNG